MCSVCGCSHGEMRIGGAHVGHDHAHDHGPAHHHHPDVQHEAAHGGHEACGHASSPDLISVEQSILAKNQAFADDNRQFWNSLDLLCLNLISSPGAGKTSLLVKTLEALRAEVPLWVIEGDQETSNDADRIRQTGVPAVQINTGRGCHLDAHSVGHAAAELAVDRPGILFIENIGNLVCPAGFDLGETKRAVILSVTEGADKPIKYPDVFAGADVMVLSKIDLLPYVDFDESEAIAFAKRVNPSIEVLRSSTTAEDGLADWLGWLRSGLRTMCARPDGVARAPAEFHPSTGGAV